MPSGHPSSITLPSIGELVLDEHEYELDGTNYIDSLYETAEPIEFGDQGVVTICIWLASDKPLDFPEFITRVESRFQALRDRIGAIILESESGWREFLQQSGPSNTPPEEVSRVAKLIVANATAHRVFIQSDTTIKPNEDCHRIDIGLKRPLTGYGEWEWFLDDHDLEIHVASDYHASSVNADG